jgi:hypothetical protein
MACSSGTSSIVSEEKTLNKPPQKVNVTSKTRGKTWSDEATKKLIELWGEETIQIALDNAKTSKQSSQIYKTLLASSEIIF